MVNSEKFDSISDLYKRVLPALQAKVMELKREKILNIDSVDIWNYALENIWKDKSDLRIYELVDDILNIDGIKLQVFVKDRFYKKIDRNEIDER